MRQLKMGPGKIDADLKLHTTASTLPHSFELRSPHPKEGV